MKAEENRLRSLDATQNVQFLRKKKQELQDYFYKTEYQRNAFNSEVKS